MRRSETKPKWRTTATQQTQFPHLDHVDADNSVQQVEEDEATVSEAANQAKSRDVNQAQYRMAGQ